ncbi:MAG: 50S ribosomal protein L29 [Candidatus Latescibacterota bacterium]
MKPQDIREKTLDEVKNDLAAAEENLRTLRFQLVTSQLEKTSMIGQVRRDIARLKTLIREYELGVRGLAAPGKQE